MLVVGPRFGSARADLAAVLTYQAARWWSGDGVDVLLGHIHDRVVAVVVVEGPLLRWHFGDC